MNAIELKERVDFYLDSTRNGRFNFLDYKKGVNDAIEKFVNDQFGDLRAQNNYGFQVIQQLRDNLFTLIADATPTITVDSTITSRYGTFIRNHVNFPAGYYMFIALRTTINGFSDYARPTTYNEVGPLLNDSFKKPSNTMPYYIEDSTGLLIYRGNSGTFTQAELTYLRTPATYSIGTEANLISAGAGVLTNATSYIAVETSVHNGVTYNPGTQFTSANTNLTSGTVILTANTTPCDLPEKVHEEIAKIAAQIMSGVISDYSRSQFVEKEAQQG